MLPGSAICWSLAATLTQCPWMMLARSCITSPTLMPMRNWIGLPLLQIA